MARPSAGFTVALKAGQPPQVGAACPACHQVTMYPLMLGTDPISTARFGKVMEALGDVAALLHVCPDPRRTQEAP